MATTKSRASDELAGFEYLINEMCGVVKGKLSCGRELTKEERALERFMKGIIHSWVKPFRRHAREMARLMKERDCMLDALVRIGNWCAQDLAENAYVSEGSGNYLKTLNGLARICRPYMRLAIKQSKRGVRNEC